MYSINRDANKITPLERRSFRELGFAERPNLQKWLSDCPEALEPLLIVKKEFSGWDKTSERLDLLALDTSGRLAIIELKLDDSGRDVTWQALKYAAYCSQLRTGQIVEMLRAHRGLETAEDARAVILDFLGRDDDEDLVLNSANSQRVILVAARFRPEVTATALWLVGRGLDVACYQITPFQMGDEILLGVDQIIPVPEAGDYMITVAEKTQEEEGQSRAGAERHRRLRTYWSRLLDVFETQNIPYYRNKSATGDNWMSTPIGVSGGGVNQTLVITRSDIRAQINIERADADANAAAFRLLLEKRAEIETAFGGELDWIEKEGVKTRRITAALQIDTTDNENIDTAITWQADAIQRLSKAITPYLSAIEAAMNSAGA